MVLHRINALRESVGLGPAHPTTLYQSDVARAIAVSADPTLPAPNSSVVGEQSLWGALPGTSSVSPPEVDIIVNDWVFRDGWLGSPQMTENIDCTSPTAADCNGHRRAILSTPPTPGATLLVDVATGYSTWHGIRCFSVAVLMVWRAP